MKPLNNKIIAAIAAIIVLAAGSMAATAYAFTFQAPWPQSPAGTKIQDNPTLAWGIKYIYEWGVGLGGIAVFIVMVMAGFQYITSVGDPTKMKDAFKRIEEAVIGLVILLSSYAILNLVGINLNDMKVTMFEPHMTNPIKPCTSAEGQVAEECCEGITNCIPDFQRCVNGTCQIKTDAKSCDRVIIEYAGSGSYEIGSGEFNKKKPLNTSKSVAGMKRYYDGNKLCFDSTNPDADDPKKNAACSCSVQAFIKLSTVNTGNATVNDCSSSDEQKIVVHTEDLKSYSDGKSVVCAEVISPEE